MDVRLLQECIKETYYEKDSRRGISGTFVWFIEEVGELARAIGKDHLKEKEEEFADVFAWLLSLANLCDVDLAEVSRKYLTGCPKCNSKRCACQGYKYSDT